MPPQKRKKAQCQVCARAAPRYTCAACLIVYCSVGCYKAHKSSGCSAQSASQAAAGPSTTDASASAAVDPDPGLDIQAEVDHTRATGAPGQPSRGDRLGVTPAHAGASTSASTANSPADIAMDVGAEKDDPPLEADPPRLRSLASLNWPYVPEESAYPDPLKRDDPKTLQPRHYEAIATSPSIRRALTAHPTLVPLLTSIDALRGPERERALERALGVAAPDIANRAGGGEVGEDVLALRALAEAVEAAVRGENRAALGLDWDGDE